MKKIALALLIVFSLATFSSFASAGSAIVPVVGGDAYTQKLELLKRVSTMSLKEFEAFTGKKMNIVDRTFFKLGQKKLKKSFDENGNLTNKKLEKYLKKGGAGSDSGFHLGGFALGFLLGLIGVLIAYVAFSDGNKQNRIKWSWIGVLAIVAISLLAFLL